MPTKIIDLLEIYEEPDNWIGRLNGQWSAQPSQWKLRTGDVGWHCTSGYSSASSIYFQLMNYMKLWDIPGVPLRAEEQPMLCLEFRMTNSNRHSNTYSMYSWIQRGSFIGPSKPTKPGSILIGRVDNIPFDESDSFDSLASEVIRESKRLYQYVTLKYPTNPFRVVPPKVEPSTFSEALLFGDENFNGQRSSILDLTEANDILMNSEFRCDDLDLHDYLLRVEPALEHHSGRGDGVDKGENAFSYYHMEEGQRHTYALGIAWSPSKEVPVHPVNTLDPVGVLTAEIQEKDDLNCVVETYIYATGSLDHQVMMERLVLPIKNAGYTIPAEMRKLQRYLSQLATKDYAGYAGSHVRAKIDAHHRRQVTPSQDEI